LSEVFRLIEELRHPDVRVAGILVDKAPAVSGQPHDRDAGENEFAEHSPPPCALIPRPASPASPSRRGSDPTAGRLANLGPTGADLESQSVFPTRKVGNPVRLRNTVFGPCVTVVLTLYVRTPIQTTTPETRRPPGGHPVVVRVVLLPSYSSGRRRRLRPGR